MTSWLDVLTVVVQPEGGNTPAAAKQVVAVTVELVAPGEVLVFTIVRVQVTSYPAPVGKAGGSHWLTAGAVASAFAPVLSATISAKGRSDPSKKREITGHFAKRELVRWRKYLVMFTLAKTLH